MNPRRRRPPYIPALLVVVQAACGQQILDRLDGETLYEGGWLLTAGFAHSVGDADSLPARETEQQATLSLQHGLRNDLQLGVAIGWLAHQRTGPGPTQDSAAVGDLSLLGKWRCYRWEAPGKALNVALLGELSLPTGEDDARSAGLRLEPELQAGSGGVDPALGLGATYEPGRWRFNAAGLHRWHTDTDSDDTRPGDELVAEIAAGNRFWLEPYPGPFMRLDLFARYYAQRRSELAGVRLFDSGGERTTIGLNWAFRPRPQLDLQVRVETPFWQEVNGAQPGEDWTLDISVGLRF
jgi:hypothetical protein